MCPSGKRRCPQCRMVIWSSRDGHLGYGCGGCGDGAGWTYARIWNIGSCPKVLKEILSVEHHVFQFILKRSRWHATGAVSAWRWLGGALRGCREGWVPSFEVSTSPLWVALDRTAFCSSWPGKMWGRPSISADLSGWQMQLCFPSKMLRAWWMYCSVGIGAGLESSWKLLVCVDYDQIISDQ